MDDKDFKFYCVLKVCYDTYQPAAVDIEPMS